MLRILSLLAALVLLDLCHWAAAQERLRPPNIVLFLADDLGYGELGCQGNTQIPTPHIDSLAAGGVRCTSGYVTASYCSPSRAGLLTGRYPSRFGYEINPVGARNEDPTVGLPDSERTLAEHLRDSGYTTALFGKWHLGGTAAYHPLRRGFDEFFGFLHEGHFYVPPPYKGVTTMLRRRVLPEGSQGQWTSADGGLIYSTHMGHNEPPYDAGNPIIRGGQPVVESAHLTDAVTREALDFIERHAEAPFFMYIAYNAVHSPLQADNRYLEQLPPIDDPQRRIFAGMLTHLDASVGAVLDKLHAADLDERTLIFFISDNGGPTRELTSSNAPLRGGKGDLYEGGVRVPLLVKWTNVLPAGATYHQPVSTLDVFATAAALTGASTTNQLDGVNLLPYLTGENDTAPHSELYWRVRNKAALRAGDWKIVSTQRRYGSREWQLFDLAKDVSETEDLASRHPEKLKEMIGFWQQLDQEMAAQ